MKRISLSGLLLILVLLSGCYKDPVASFTMSASSVEVGESITFNNTSVDADRSEWLFGDGSQSTQDNPTHTYDNPGTYDVVLRVFSKKDMKADIASNSVTIIQPTVLVVNVYDYEDEEPLDGATVLLYSSENDFYADDDRLGEGITGSTGSITFDDIPSGELYISVFRDEYEESGYLYFYSNWFISLEGNTYVTQVQANKINELSIYCRFGYIESGGRIDNSFSDLPANP